LLSGQESKKAHPRDRSRIYYDILCSIIEHEQSEGGAKITRIQNDVNLPSDLFREHLSEMEKFGLLHRGETISATERGKEFVSEYKHWTIILRRFGLA
jgi:predicted transcriptional regulator